MEGLYYVAPLYYLGITMKICEERDALLTEFGKTTLRDRYLLPDETYQGLFKRVSERYGSDPDHAQRLYEYMSQHWFMPATPILSNGGTTRGLPISCFVNECDDSLHGIADLWMENIWLASKGGGVGSYWGNVRSIGEAVGRVGKSSGIIPFVKVMDSLTLAISQGSLRRGSAAVYLPIDHPEIEEFIEMRRPTGGDPNRKSPNIHHGVTIPDKFMWAVESGSDWDLVSPKTGEVVRTVNARALWIRLLTARMEQGEPYIVFSDTVNRARPEHHRLAGLGVKTSNLCAEIMLPTGIDHHGRDRTAVCCLSSVNIEHWDQWKDIPEFIPDIMLFLDNVLQDFIDNAPPEMKNAVYSAKRQRSVGLGVMGFHSFLQSKGVPFECAVALGWNTRIFKHLRDESERASMQIAKTRRPCPDADEYGIKRRFSHTMAVAPTATISVIAGEASPGIDPISANVFLQKTLSGSFMVRNKHLKAVLRSHSQDTPEVWSSITLNKGSVQHLDFLTQDEKDVFKTAFEIDQRWVVQYAASRAPYIDQSQSVNLFMLADVEKRDLHNVHIEAWKGGVKSLYYCRSLSIQRADTVSDGNSCQKPKQNYEECIACQ